MCRRAFVGPSGLALYTALVVGGSTETTRVKRGQCFFSLLGVHFSLLGSPPRGARVPGKLPTQRRNPGLSSSRAGCLWVMGPGFLHHSRGDDARQQAEIYESAATKALTDRDARPTWGEVIERLRTEAREWQSSAIRLESDPDAHAEDMRMSGREHHTASELLSLADELQREHGSDEGDGNG
jgi:hypothetical protein